MVIKRKLPTQKKAKYNIVTKIRKLAPNKSVLNIISQRKKLTVSHFPFFLRSKYRD